MLHCVNTTAPSITAITKLMLLASEQTVTAKTFSICLQYSVRITSLTHCSDIQHHRTIRRSQRRKTTRTPRELCTTLNTYTFSRNSRHVLTSGKLCTVFKAVQTITMSYLLISRHYIRSTVITLPIGSSLSGPKSFSTAIWLRAGRPGL